MSEQKKSTLKDQILAKMQQNKADRAKHQEQVEGLDRGLIYLQGQLDLVNEMATIVEKQTALAKAAEEAKAAAQASAPAAPALSVVPDAPAASESAAPVELSPLPAAPSDAPASN